MKHFKAIAAMSLNRVIGAGNKIPWDLPEDFKWFKQLTTGNVIVMAAGKRETESARRPCEPWGDGGGGQERGATNR